MLETMGHIQMWEWGKVDRPTTLTTFLVNMDYLAGLL